METPPMLHITVLIRDSVQAHKLEPFGVKAVLGSLQDTDKLVALASEADLVFNCVSQRKWVLAFANIRTTSQADADDIQCTKAILT